MSLKDFQWKCPMQNEKALPSQTSRPSLQDSKSIQHLVFIMHGIGQINNVVFFFSPYARKNLNTVFFHFSADHHHLLYRRRSSRAIRRTHLSSSRRMKRFGSRSSMLIFFLKKLFFMNMWNLLNLINPSTLG